MLLVEPVILGEWKARAKMRAHHLVGFRARDADQRMPEGVGDSEADGLHGLLEGREVTISVSCRVPSISRTTALIRPGRVICRA